MRSLGVRGLVGMLCALGALAAAAPGIAGATVVYKVDTTKDGNLSNPNDTNCVAAVEATNKCTLRAAIQAADNTQANDPGTSVKIRVPAGTYKLTDTDPSQPVGTTYLYVEDDGRLAIVGAGAGSTVVNADFTDRAFWLQNDLSNSGPVTISGMKIENGRPGQLGTELACPESASSAANENGGGILQENAGLTLKNDAVSDNMAPGWGGGIDNEGTGALTIIGTKVSHNISCQSNSGLRGGGGISEYEGGALTIRHSTISHNSAAQNGSGGGVLETESAATVHIFATTISGNDAYSGGGIEAAGGGTFLLFADLLTRNTASNLGGGFDNSNGDLDSFINTTFTANSASSGGGGIQAGGRFTDNGFVPGETISFSTLNHNSSPGGAGNIGVGEGAGATVDDSIVVKGQGGNCPGFGVTDNGHNVFSDNSCGSGNHDVITNHPKLGPLADNGGPTRTEALLPGSPAVDHASTSRCDSETKNGAGHRVDQREIVIRPQGPRCDSGAFEATPDLVLTASALHNSIFTGQQDTVTETVDNTGPTVASDSTFTDPGAGYRIDSVTTSQGTCSHTAQSVSCQLGAIASGGKVTITIVLTGTSPGTITLKGRTRTTGTDLTPKNNRRNVRIKVKPRPKPPPPPKPGKPKVSLARLGPACYPVKSTIHITATAHAPAGIRKFDVRVHGHGFTTGKGYASTSSGSGSGHGRTGRKATIHLEISASKLHPGGNYTVSARVVDKLGRSDRAQRTFTVCKPSQPGFTG